MELLAPSRWRSVDFISDLHLHPDEPLTFQAWLRYLQRTTADAIFILGDLFEVWVGDDCLNRDAFARQCAGALCEAANHANLFIMHGNRDFLMGAGLMQDSQARLIEDPMVLVFNDARFLLTHGDALCLDDSAYQTFRTTVRSAAWQHQFLAQTLEQRQHQARQMRSQSEDQKRSVREYADVDEAAATQLMKNAGALTLIHGHTHRPARHDLGQGMQRWVLSDWHLDGTQARGDVLRLHRGASGPALQRISLSMAEAIQPD